MPLPYAAGHRDVSLRFRITMASAIASTPAFAAANAFPEALRDAVLGNVGTLAVFRVGSRDAAVLVAELDIKMPSTLSDTPNFEAWVKTLRDETPVLGAPDAARRTKRFLSCGNKSHPRATSPPVAGGEAFNRGEFEALTLDRSCATFYPQKTAGRSTWT